MNRFAVIIALTIVVLGTSVATSFSVATSLAFATVLVAGAMFLHEFAFSVGNAGGAAAGISHAREFLACVVQYTIRFAIAALAIAWTVVSLQWYAGG